jgi:amino acid adenylation domain-containing protein/non-ribosomal peptide synthase protein (TIGR01720 family)
MNIAEFIYELNNLGFSIWLENGNIKYRQYKECENKNEIISKLLENKKELINFLDINNFYSSNQITPHRIYASDNYRELLSFAQERLWFIEKYEEGTNAYNISMIFKLSSDTNLEILEESIRDVVSRHEVLRTVIEEDREGRGYQLVLDDKECPLEVQRIRISNEEELHAELERSVNYIYDLSKEYPIRVSLYEISDNNKKEGKEHYLSIVVHHIAFDGWSNDIFLRDLQAYYKYHWEHARGLNTGLDLQDLSIQYKDFSLWQRHYLSGERLEKQLAYWKDKLSGHETLNLVTDKLRPSQVDYVGHDVPFEIDEEISLNLRELAKELNVSLYSLLLSGYYLMLRTYSNQNDIVVGATVANRHYSQIEEVIGFFANTLALRTKIDSRSSIKAFIQQVGQEVIEAQLHQDLPFEKLVEELGVSKDTSRHPIFQVLFEVQSFGGMSQDHGNQQKETDLGHLLEPYTGPNPYNVAKFDMSALIDDSQVALKGNFNYAVSLYKEETISGLIETYIEILKQLANLVNRSQQQEQTKIDDIRCLSEARYHEIVEVWNETEEDYPRDKTIHELFEEQVERTPDSVAVVCEGSQLTYRELNNRASQLAHYLRNKHDIEADDLITLCLDRSEHMLIAILAVLKAGGAYVPVDPSYPDERIQYVLEDTNAKVVLTNAIYKERLRNLSKNLAYRENTKPLEILAIDSSSLGEALSTQTPLNPGKKVSSANLAYVIYTSGTTGNPKGVMIDHNGVVNRIKWMDNIYPLNESDRILQKTPYVFDVSVWELLWANWYGACLVFAKPEGHKDANYILNLIHQESITISHFVPSMLNVFEDTFKTNIEKLGINNEKPIPTLRYVFCSGEALNLNHVKKFHKILPNTEIHNLYGPTEASIDVLYYDCNNKKIKEIYIGKQIHNIKAYVLDLRLAPVPLGAIGELYVGGIGLARGYLNKPDLTAERFIANPYQTREEAENGENSRLYKTGDLVRWLPDGNLEYIGRNDFQVKIRGYRIELEEIENVLSSYEGIRQSIVLVKEHVDSAGNLTGNKYLIGYYLSKIKLSEEHILAYLQSKLPDYMVPTRLVHLEKFPLTINGKLDKKALPEIESREEDNYVAPRNELERKVCEIWAEVLGLSADKVGIHDDFFKLGGDSIVSIQLVSRLRQRVGVIVSVKDIFTYRSIERLHDNVIGKGLINDIKTIKAEQGILSGEVALLPIQEWFFESKFNKPDHWNQSFIIRIPVLDLDKLQESIAKLVNHHDSFRLRYKKAEALPLSNSPEVVTDIRSQYTQYYDINAKAEKLKILDIKTLGAAEGSQEFEDKLQEILTQWQGDFNLERGPIYSIGYIYGYADGSSRLHFAFHHLMVDTISWRLLTEDLRDIYNQKALGPKGSSYRHWVDTVEEYAKTHESEKVYWTNILADYDDNRDQINKLVVSEATRNQASLILSQEQTKQLLQESNRAYNTQVNDILLTALGLTLSEVTGIHTNYIVLEGHGREEIDGRIDITRTVGWFTTMYPVRLEVSEELGNSIKKVKESLRQIPNRGIGYGALLGYKPNSLPRISFNYLGQFDKEDNLQVQNWTIVNERSGEAVHPDNEDYNIININGLIIDGRLQFSIVSKLSESMTSKVSELFKHKLEEVIRYTANHSRSYLTASDIGYIITPEHLEKVQDSREIDGVYLANSLQQGFIYHALNQGDVDDAYRMQLIWQYNSVLEINLLKKAWDYAQKRYPSLRLRFAWEEELVQIIDKEGYVDWRYIDLSGDQDSEVQRLKIKKIQEEDRLEHYKLDQGSLFRVYLIKQKENLYTCIFSNHHSILDGWSNPILLSNIHETYLRLQDKELVGLKVEHSYENTQRYLQEHKDDNNAFWNKYISRIEERGDLSGLLSVTSKNKLLKVSEYNHITEPRDKILRVREETYQQLKRLSQEEGITLNAILQYVWHKVLSVYGNSNQTIVGTVVSGRNIPIDDIESAVGLYINTLPLIVDHSHKNASSIIELIKDIHREINEISSRSNVNLAKLQGGGHRLFDTLFVYENYPNPTNESRQNRINIDFKGSVEKLDYPLGVIVYEERNQLKFKVSYAGELFDDVSISNMLSVIEHLLEQIATQPYQPVQELKYLNEAQYHEIVEVWNETEEDYPRDKTIHELFEEQVEKTPDSVAVVYEGSQLTYRELNNRANQLAHYLRILGVKSNSLVAISIERSIELVIGLFGILKAGGAYIPLDPSYPQERLEFMLEDTRASILLTQRVVKDNFANYSGKVISLDENWDVIEREYNTNPVCVNNSYNVAYIVYTSGSTGKPKGVICNHQGVINRLYWAWEKYNFKKYETCCLQSSIAFVDSTWDIFGTLLVGAKLVLYNEEIGRDIKRLVNQCVTSQITRITLVPSLFKVLINLVFSDQALFNSIGQIQHWEVTGEQFNTEEASRQFSTLFKNNFIFLDCYGASEATSVLYRDFSLSEKPKTYIINNTQIYLLDQYMKPLPIGAIGEIYIGGVGLADGYLNRPELTAEKFVSNPFVKDKSLKLYKTGDLGRWYKDGNMEFLGRIDNQIKIRGYRIELGEIESILQAHKNVSNCIAVVNKDDQEDKNLVAYVVPKNTDAYGIEKTLTSSSEEEFSVLKGVNLANFTESLREYLKKKVPDYMVPAFFVYLDRIPLTPNGKTDRKSLPALNISLRILTNSYTSPRNELEKQICQIWAEILKLPEDKVGIHDDFFRLGGNSILAIKLSSKINKGLGISINVSAIFRYNTVSKLAHYIQNNSDDRIIISKSKIEKVEEQLLSFAQERLWFIEKYEEGTNAYNISMIFKLSSDTNLEILEESIRDVVSRHEVLRTVIEEDREGRGYQLVLDDKECPLEVQRIRISNEEELHAELERSVNYIYDLSKEYPIRVSLYEISDNNKKEGKEHYLSIVVHHIAFDGWSNDIFLRDLQAYYKYHWEHARGLNTGLDLQDLSIQYKDFSLWQRHYLSGERLEKQLAYWKDKLSGHETLNLVTDKLRPSQVDYVGHDVPFEIDEEISLNLRELAKELNVSLYSLLLSGYYLMLRTYSNQNDIVVGATVANRHYSQIEEVIGFFANTLALRTKIDSRSSIKAFIQQVGQEVIEAQLHQDLPFEKLVEELGVSKDTSRHPIFQVLFEVQSFGGMSQDHGNQQKETDLGHLLEPYTGPNPYNVAKFDMSALIDDSQVALKGNFNYAVSLYKEETISGLIETYIEILKQLANLVNRSQQQEQTKIDDIRCLSEARYHEIVEVWNETEEDYPRDKTIHELFEEQVERTPDRVAAHDNTQSITYSELNKKANQLARYLKSKGIGIDDPVIVVMDRSIDLIISILAISKSGGVYVPTDPYAPAKRNIYICQNAKANIVITSSKFDWLDSVNSEIIILNKIEPEISTQDSSNLNVPINPLNLSYIIFTSGSTGLPKGVMLSHEGMINHMFCKIRDLYIDDSDIIAQTATQIFDISIWQLLTSLATGGKVVVFSEQVIKDPKQFIEAVARENITILELVPAYAHSMALYMQSNNSNAFKFLKHLVITGEALKNKVCQEIFNISKEISIVNAYGPTECSDDVTHYHYKFDQHIDNDFTVIPLGKALQNLQLYILNTNLLPLPIGVIGELYVGGIILARGYYDRPDLTAEKFIANPFASEEDVKLKKNLRLYRTGDLCKYLSDGSIEYIGRTDEQVKVRGYRIELEEIESVLSSHEGIKEAAVIVKRQKDATGSSISNESLVGYYIADQGLSENEVMDYLRGKLPDYMVPTRLVHLEKFPLTINGKLDKKALPEIESREEDNYVAPRNELERKVCEIWAEVLGLSADKVGIHDDFFKLGGNSIAVITLVMKLNNYYKARLKISDIFVHKTVDSVLKKIIQSKDSYQAIIKLNNTCNKPNMFMIHPATGGCEVYISLANLLDNHFSCYGVDSYNLYNNKKIENMNELAKYYTSYIKDIMNNTNQKECHMLGWSLGGEIALEIAAILEKEKKFTPKLYLLDCFPNDDYLASLNTPTYIEKIKNGYKNYGIEQGYDKLYIEKVVSNIDVEARLSNKKISSALKMTQALLFKAMLEEIKWKNYNPKNFHEYITSLEYNNLEKIIENKSDIKLVQINDAHHGNILDQENILISEILNFQNRQLNLLSA